jgi:hypothetical protein
LKELPVARNITFGSLGRISTPQFLMQASLKKLLNELPGRIIGQDVAA